MLLLGAHTRGAARSKGAKPGPAALSFRGFGSGLRPGRLGATTPAGPLGAAGHGTSQNPSYPESRSLQVRGGTQWHGVAGGGWLGRCPCRVSSVDKQRR